MEKKRSYTKGMRPCIITVPWSKCVWRLPCHNLSSLNIFLASYCLICWNQCSVQFSCSVMSDSLWPHGLQHARPPCSSPTPRVYPNSCPLSWWCHPTISSSVIPFSSCLKSFPTSGSSDQFFASGGQVLEFQLQHQSFQWIFRTDFLLGLPWWLRW